jgi:hypothetical protein
MSWVQKLLNKILCQLLQNRRYYLHLVHKSGRQPLLSSCQSSWLQIQRSGFDSQHWQIIWEVVDLEWGLLSLVSTIEELLGRNSSGSGLENQEYSHRDPLCWLRDTLNQQKLALTSLTSGGRSVGIVRSRTKATEFVPYESCSIERKIRTSYSFLGFHTQSSTSLSVSTILTGKTLNTKLHN